MISSAVLIPEEPQAQPETASPNTLKRRPSSTSLSSESSKRLRLDAQASINGTTRSPPRTGPSPSPTTGSGAMSPPSRQPEPRRRQPSSSLEQDKSRNRRLFGALLGTLSQSSRPAKPSGTSTSTHVSAPPSRREEIESRQRERLKRESEEIASSAQRKKEELDRVRRVEQRRWDEEGMKIRHRNLRATAGFLQTKAEPILYYKPWELREEEEEVIRRQREDVEETIKREVEEFEAKRARGENNDGEIPSHSPQVGRNGGMEVDDDQLPRGNDDIEMRTGEQDKASQNGAVKAGDHASSSESLGEAKHAKPAKEVEVERSQGKDDDHGGEELEQGQEDDVIY